MESTNLTLDEASLTGESQPIVKISESLSNKKSTETDQNNMVFKGTHVVAGTGSAIVVATGLQTMIGKISATVSTINTEDPLKKDIAQLSKLIILATVAISVTIFIIGVARQQSLLEMFATVVSLSVSIIPEGLPIVITLVLATGVWRMSKQHALVKKLQAVESLGQARVIAVDKTGTITKNEMTLQKVYAGGKTYDITGAGYEPVGQAVYKGQPVEPTSHSILMKAAQYAGYCANAHASLSEDTKLWQVSGDPTEASMLVFAEKLGFSKTELEKHAPLIAELPFSSQTKYHATLHQQGQTNILVAIGAPEIILHHSSKIILKTEGAETLTAATKRSVETNIEKLSSDGLRVLGIAVMESKNHTINVEDISGLTFIGLFGIRDALRPEVHEAVAKAKSAGIKVVMITGDHVTTARAIATQAGIFKNGDNVLTGQDLDALSAAQLSRKLEKTSVFARVSPTHKLKIIEAYQHSGKIIAMTGDGVNDAPSLVAADLGVAMGGIGTEVAKEAADIILLDDNFGSMVSAIEEGRSIYKTIKKVILYLFSTGLGEVLAIAGALIIALPLPVSPTQIIWLNFVTDGFLVVALGMEPKERGLLKSTFNSQSRSLVDMLMAKRILIMGVTMMVGTLALFNQYLTLSPEKAGTIALTVLAIFQWFNAWNARSETRSIFTINPFSNLYLLGALGIVIALQLLAVYNPIAQKLLHTTPLSFYEWIICITAASSILVVEEIRKSLARAKLHRN
jgi:Ca2+-transporting ATPase